MIKRITISDVKNAAKENEQGLLSTEQKAYFAITKNSEDYVTRMLASGMKGVFGVNIQSLTDLQRTYASMMDWFYDHYFCTYTDALDIEHVGIVAYYSSPNQSGGFNRYRRYSENGILEVSEEKNISIYLGEHSKIDTLSPYQPYRAEIVDPITRRTLIRETAEVKKHCIDKLYDILNLTRSDRLLLTLLRENTRKEVAAIIGRAESTIKKDIPILRDKIVDTDLFYNNNNLTFDLILDYFRETS